MPRLKLETLNKVSGPKRDLKLLAGITAANVFALWCASKPESHKSLREPVDYEKVAI